MGHKKLIKFAAIKTFPNVLEFPENMKGNWKTHFGNENPVTLELACGRGEYTVELAGMYPNRNFIGVDIKGNRIHAGAKKCLQQQRGNAAFLRTQIQMLDIYFAPGEVKSIWLTFPDPQLRTSRAKNRLTHPKYLRVYQQILAPGAGIHLKTDSPVLFYFTQKVIELYGLELVASNDNVYAQTEISDELKIKTYYESLDIAGSRRVFYLHFRLPEGPLPDRDGELQAHLKQTENSREMMLD